MAPQKSKTPFIPVFVFIAFPLVVLGVTMYVQYPFWTQIFVSERGAATWVSSMLLCCAASVALLTGALSEKKYLWFIFACALLFLAADERFMIHEYLKHCILYYLFQNDPHRMGYAGDLPVVAAGIAGTAVAVSFFLRTATLSSRLLIAAMAICGGLSVTFDVLYVNAVGEEVLKLAAELICLFWLSAEFGRYISGLARQSKRE
jgi:hypothetical protein